MTSAQIAEFRAKVEKSVENGMRLAKADNKPANLDLQQPTFTVLSEIAYQLAVMNEGRNAPHVIELHTNGRPFCVGVDEIASLKPAGSGSHFVPRGGHATHDTVVVDESYDDVRAKLGIRTE